MSNFVSKIHSILKCACSECGNKYAERETTTFMKEDGEAYKIEKIVTCYICDTCHITLD